MTSGGGTILILDTPLINIRPAAGNPTMEVQDPLVRRQIQEITFALIGRGEEVWECGMHNSLPSVGRALPLISRS